MLSAQSSAKMFGNTTPATYPISNWKRVIYYFPMTTWSTLQIKNLANDWCDIGQWTNLYGFSLYVKRSHATLQLCDRLLVWLIKCIQMQMLDRKAFEMHSTLKSKYVKRKVFLELKGSRNSIGKSEQPIYFLCIIYFFIFFSLSPFFQEQTLVKTLVEQLCIFRDFINNTKTLEAPKGSSFVTSLQQIGDDLTYPISNF